MAGFGVKNTTKIKIFDLLCPYYCRGCGRIGAVFCDCCKKYLSTAKIHHDIYTSMFEKVFMVGYYDGLIGRLIKEYKYNSVRALADVLADFIDESLPIFSEKVILVPLPTIPKHIRQRGFDHIGFIANKLAKKRGWEVEKCLSRNKNSIQVGMSGNVRRAQAREAYKIEKRVYDDKCYLLLDDVWTTGASMNEAAKVMKENGATRLMCVVLGVNRGENERCAIGTASERIENEIDDGVG